MSLNAMNRFSVISKMIHLPLGSFRLKFNLTRTFVPEFSFRFLGPHKFNQAGQMPKQVPRAGA